MNEGTDWMTVTVEQKLLEEWWNEDPGMRYVEILCGREYRICVRLFQIDISGVSGSTDGCNKVGEYEDGTLELAIRGAMDNAKLRRDDDMGIDLPV